MGWPFVHSTMLEEFYFEQIIIYSYQNYQFFLYNIALRTTYSNLDKEFESVKAAVDEDTTTILQLTAEVNDFISNTSESVTINASSLCITVINGIKK